MYVGNTFWKTCSLLPDCSQIYNFLIIIISVHCLWELGCKVHKHEYVVWYIYLFHNLQIIICHDIEMWIKGWYFPICLFIIMIM